MKQIILAITIILSPLFYIDALGCSCPTIGMTPEQAKAARLKDFQGAAAVFTGEVVELDENKVKFKVEKIWKGQSVDEIVMVIQLKKDDGRYVRTSCDYYYELGEKYLVYAYGTSEELTTYQCTRTTRFKNTELVEEETKGLNEIKLPEIRKKNQNSCLCQKAKSNKSMDVRAKQRLSYSRCPLNSELRDGGFAPRHLNRSTSFFT